MATTALTVLTSGAEAARATAVRRVTDATPVTDATQVTAVADASPSAVTGASRLAQDSFLLGDMSTLVAVVAGALVGGGLMLLISAIRGRPPRPARPDKRRDREALMRTLSTRGSAAVLAGAGVLIVTRWPVAALGAGLLVLGWRGIAGGAIEERKAMARLEGLAAWTESLRDTIAGAVGLEQAIPSSVRAAAPALQEPLRALVDRLHTRVPLPEALRRFADDLDDPSADLVVGALILNARLRGPGLRDMLGALAASAREEIDMRRRVEANRRTTRRSVQIVVGISVFTMMALVIFRREYVAEYDTLLGQLVLGVVVGLFAAGFVWLRRLANFEMPGRFLSATSTATATATASPTASAASATAGSVTTSAPGRTALTSAATPSGPPSTSSTAASSSGAGSSTAAGSSTNSGSDAGSPTESRPGAGSPTESRPGAGSATWSWPGSGSATESWPGTGSATESWPGTGSPTESRPGTGSATRSWPGTGSATESQPSGVPPVPGDEGGSGRTRPAQGGGR